MKELKGATVEHWMIARQRQNKPINDPTNLIRISAKDFLILIKYKNEMLDIKRTLKQESDEFEEKQKEQFHD